MFRISGTLAIPSWMHYCPFLVKYIVSFADCSTPDKPPALKLILKVGGSSGTPEHGSESPSQANMLSQHYQQQLGINYSVTQGDSEYDRSVCQLDLMNTKSFIIHWKLTMIIFTFCLFTFKCIFSAKRKKMKIFYFKYFHCLYF